MIAHHLQEVDDTQVRYQILVGRGLFVFSDGRHGAQLLRSCQLGGRPSVLGLSCAYNVRTVTSDLMYCVSYL